MSHTAHLSRRFRAPSRAIFARLHLLYFPSCLVYVCMRILQRKNHRTSPMSNARKVATNVDFEKGATMTGRHQNVNVVATLELILLDNGNACFIFALCQHVHHVVTIPFQWLVAKKMYLLSGVRIYKPRQGIIVQSWLLSLVLYKWEGPSITEIWHTISKQRHSS